MTDPTREQIAKAYAALFSLADYAVTQAEDREQADRMRAYNHHILKALPPKPRPTMAEVEWDDDKHFLAEAEHEDGSDTIMLWKTTSGCISIIRNGLVGAVYPDTLTPTGRRYVLQDEE